MAAAGAQRYLLEGCLCHHTTTHVSRPLQAVQLALPLQGDGRCLRRCISVHATGTVLSRYQKQSTAIATESDMLRSVMETTIKGVEQDVENVGIGSSKQKAVWLAYLNRMQQRKGLQHGSTPSGKGVGETVSENETQDYMRDVVMPQDQRLHQVQEGTSHTHDGNDSDIAHATAEDQLTATITSDGRNNIYSAPQQSVNSTCGKRPISQKQGSKKTGRKSVTQPPTYLDSGKGTDLPLSTVTGHSEPDAAKQVTLPLLKDDEMASEGAWLNPVYRTIRKAQLLHVKQAAGAQLAQQSQPGSSSATLQPAVQVDETNHAGNTNMREDTGAGQRMGSVTDCLTLSEDRSRLNPVIRLIRKKELQMARRAGSSQAAGVPAASHEVHDGIDNTDRSGSSTAGPAVMQTSGTEAADPSFRIIPEHQIASERARMNPVYRMIRKMELTKKLKRTDDSVPAATASVGMTYNSRPSGLASLISLSDSLLTLSELDPSHKLASSLDPGSLTEDAQDGGLPDGAAAGTDTASTQLGRKPTGLLGNRGERELDRSRAASLTAGTPARHAYLGTGMTSRQAAQPASRWGRGNDRSIRNQQQQQQQQQQDVIRPGDDDWQLPPFPSTGHTAVDRTIRIRQLSLSQRKKQQQAAMAQGLPIPYQQQRYFSRQQRRAQHMQPQKWFDDSLMHVSPLTFDETMPPSPAIVDKQLTVPVHAFTRHSQQAVGAAHGSLQSSNHTQLAVDSHTHAGSDVQAEARMEAEQQLAADVWQAGLAAPVVPGLPPGLRRRAATKPEYMPCTQEQLASTGLSSYGPKGSIKKGRRQLCDKPTAEHVEAAAVQLARLLGLDAEWRHYERSGLWEEAKRHRDHTVAFTTKLISKQPSLLHRKPEVLEANLLFLCKALGVPRARGVEAVCRQPAVLELAPASVWHRHKHLLTLAHQHCGGSMRPLDVSNAVIQAPVLLLLTPSRVKEKLLALSRMSTACTASMTAVFSHTAQLGISQACSSSSPEYSSAPHSTRLQPLEQCGTMEGAESATVSGAPGAPDMITEQAVQMLLSDPMVSRYSACKIKLKAELLFNAAAQHPAWQQQLQRMSAAYLGRCLKVSEQVLLRLQYLAEQFDNRRGNGACDTVETATDHELEQISSASEPDSSLQIVEQAPSCARMSRRPRGRPRKPPKISKPVGRPAASTLPCIGYILLTRSRDFEARYPGFTAWVGGRSDCLVLES